MSNFSLSFSKSKMIAVPMPTDGSISPVEGILRREEAGLREGGERGREGAGAGGAGKRERVAARDIMNAFVICVLRA